MRRGMFITAAILALEISACGALGGGPQATVQSGGVLLRDDFSDTGSGWDRFSSMMCSPIMKMVNIGFW